MCLGGSDKFNITPYPAYVGMISSISPRIDIVIYVYSGVIIIPPDKTHGLNHSPFTMQDVNMVKNYNRGDVIETSNKHA